MDRKQAKSQSETQTLSLFPPLELLAPTAEFSSEPPIAVPGTLQIEVLNWTGIPVLFPLPAPDSSLIFDNTSGGEIAVDARSPTGAVRVIVPHGGAVGIARPAHDVLPDLRISVEKKWLIRYKDPFNGGYREFWLKRRFVVRDDSDVSDVGPGDALPYSRQGRHPIDLNGIVG
jgi:hypothetical protein